MLIEPIEDSRAEALPRRVESASGLFAWGLPKLTGNTRLAVWGECAGLFLILPLLAIFFEARLFIPVTIGAMLSSAVILLSMTRNFHWGDLLPVDPFSEWRVVAGFAILFSTLAVAARAVLAPEATMGVDLALAPMLLAFPFLTAAPMELIHRVLFFRRFGHLFPGESSALIFGAASNALVYFMLSGAPVGAFFGAFVGVCVGWTYLRTGQFMISVIVHWLAAICVFALGPGFLIG